MEQVERMNELTIAHAAAGIGAGALGRVLGVLAVGRGVIGPKLAAGLMVGGGVAATAAGLSWGSGLLAGAGLGLAASGVMAAVTHAAVAVYEAIADDEAETAALRASKAASADPGEADGDARRNAVRAEAEAAGSTIAAQEAPDVSAKRAQRNARKRDKRQSRKQRKRHQKHAQTTTKRADATTATAADTIDDADRAGVAIG